MLSSDRHDRWSMLFTIQSLPGGEKTASIRITEAQLQHIKKAFPFEDEGSVLETSVGFALVAGFEKCLSVMEECGITIPLFVSEYREPRACL